MSLLFCWFFYFFSILLLLFISSLIFVSYILLTFILFSLFSCLKLCFYLTPSFFNVGVYSYKSPSQYCFAVSHKFCYLMILFASKYFLTLIFFIGPIGCSNMWCLISMFVYFPVFLLPIISFFILLFLENILGMI